MNNLNKKIEKIEGHYVYNGSYSKFFIKIYDELNNYNIGQSDKIIFGCIDYSCRLNNNKCNWTNEAFMVNTGLSKAQVIDSINNLIKVGLIEKKVKENNKRIILISKNFDRSGTFIKMYTELLKIKNLSINDKFIYSIIHTLANKEYNYKCFGNNTMIMKRANCKSLNTVANSIKKLQKLRIIEVTQVNKNTRIIEIKIDFWEIHDDWAEIKEEINNGNQYDDMPF